MNRKTPSRIDFEHAAYARSQCPKQRGCVWCSAIMHMRARLKERRRWGRDGLLFGEVPQIVCDHAIFGDVPRSVIEAGYRAMERA